MVVLDSPHRTKDQLKTGARYNRVRSDEERAAAATVAHSTKLALEECAACKSSSLSWQHRTPRRAWQRRCDKCVPSAWTLWPHLRIMTSGVASRVQGAVDCAASPPPSPSCTLLRRGPLSAGGAAAASARCVPDFLGCISLCQRTGAEK